MTQATAFGKRFRAARQAAGMSQDVLADLLGVTKAAVSQWELGNKSPKFQHWPTIRRVLEMPLDQLICGTNPYALPSERQQQVAERESDYDHGAVDQGRRIRALAASFAKLPPLQQHAIIELVQSMVPSAVPALQEQRTIEMTNIQRSEQE